jgi:hypothetical protein
MRLMCEKLEEDNHLVGENHCKPPPLFGLSRTLKNESTATSASGQEWKHRYNTTKTTAENKDSVHKESNIYQQLLTYTNKKTVAIQIGPCPIKTKQIHEKIPAWCCQGMNSRFLTQNTRQGWWPGPVKSKRAI